MNPYDEEMNKRIDGIRLQNNQMFRVKPQYSLEQIKELRAGIHQSNDPFDHWTGKNEEVVAWDQHAPAIVDQLLEENERLRHAPTGMSTVADYVEQVRILREENQRLKARAHMSDLNYDALENENERLKAEIESFKKDRVSLDVFNTLHSQWMDLQEKLIDTELRAQAAEDVAQYWHHTYENSDGGIMTGDESRAAVKGEIEKRLQELKGETK